MYRAAPSTQTTQLNPGARRAALDRATLPKLETPTGIVKIAGRINQPPSRNPGTFDNGPEPRLNYINLSELSVRVGHTLEPMIVEQTTGPGFTGVVRPAPGANFERNRAYQVQWYAFAAMALILFFVLSFRKQEVA